MFICFIIFWFGLGSIINRCVRFGIIHVFSNVILPKTVNFLQDHNRIIFALI